MTNEVVASSPAGRPASKMRSDIALLYAARGVRGFGDGFAIIILPAYLTAIGYDPVDIGIVATALWLIKRDGELSNLAAPEHDQGAIEMNVREAVELGRARARASAQARIGANRTTG